jgi:rubrerythrin
MAPANQRKVESLTNQEKIEILKDRQSTTRRHFGPMLCEKEAHGRLVPVEKEGKAILVCETCGYVLENIPDTVFTADYDLLERIYGGAVTLRGAKLA